MTQLGDLRVAFEDGWQLNSISHRPATVADLVSALRAEGVLVSEETATMTWGTQEQKLLIISLIDPEAQPFPPEGGS